MIYKDKYGNKFICDYKFNNCNTLILSGGAMKCMYFLGALSVINPKVKFINFGGTSCGAVLCSLLSIGYTPIEIFKKFVSIKEIPITKSLNILTKNMEIMFEEKGFNKNITFKELYEKTGNNLAFVASNVSKLREEIFSVKNHPDTSIVIAVKMSCSLPVIFPISKYNNDIFTDGIFFDNFPLKLSRIFDNFTNILAITTFKAYYDNRLSEFYKQHKLYKIVLIPDYINKHFFLNDEEKFCMFATGYNYIVENIKKNKRIRRKSI